jgi:hypothetical protein
VWLLGLGEDTASVIAVQEVQIKFLGAFYSLFPSPVRRFATVVKSRTPNTSMPSKGGVHPLEISVLVFPSTPRAWEN